MPARSRFLDRMSNSDDDSCFEGPKVCRTGEAESNKGSFIAAYVSVESVLVLFWLTASLVVLPLILPPLPPPPLILLLVPIAILVVLLVLALMPCNANNSVASAV
ncbi:hypothetical protein SUGI_0237320 [Cryptomeria japonica]|nr:hypothetical protein SUGI_0237320 [Cryptomeria japonica]